jgi:hypothetical protein
MFDLVKMTYPLMPSLATILLMPSLIVFANGGIVVCMRTFTASNGQRKRSARNSALAYLRMSITVSNSIHLNRRIITYTSTQIDHRLVHAGKHLLAIGIFEDLIETILARTLETVPHEGRRPTKEDATETFGTVYGFPSTEVGRVEFGVDLTPGLDEIEGCDGGVCWSASCWRRKR